MVLVHLLMNVTIVEGVLGGLPTLALFARVDAALLGFVLPEVETFRWEHFRSNGLLEVFVGECSVAIQVELVEDCFELLLGDSHTPELQKVFEFIFGDLSSFAHVHVLESFSDCLPLELYLFKDLILKVRAEKNLGDFASVECLQSFLLPFAL